MPFIWTRIPLQCFTCFHTIQLIIAANTSSLASFPALVTDLTNTGAGCRGWEVDWILEQADYFHLPQHALQKADWYYFHQLEKRLIGEKNNVKRCTIICFNFTSWKTRHYKEKVSLTVLACEVPLLSLEGDQIIPPTHSKGLNLLNASSLPSFFLTWTCCSLVLSLCRKNICSTVNYKLCYSKAFWLVRKCWIIFYKSMALIIVLTARQITLILIHYYFHSNNLLLGICMLDTYSFFFKCYLRQKTY